MTDTIQTIEDVLTHHHFFKGLRLNHIQTIAGCASNIQFGPGDFLFREGEEANCFYVIRHGKVTVETFVPGRGAVTLQTIGPGDVIGWSWLFPPYKWCFDARALDTTRATTFDGKCLRTKSNEDYELGYRLMERFAHIIMDRLQATRVQLLDLKF
ncbi:MAG: cyclic nucleotide-binding domain-containing protein [Chloroflexaceae bacterium]|nr:cyclic nucleotide-binding domain-containing protein [Chloroflexaceae bacterium]